MEEKNSEKKERKMRDSGIPWIGEVPERWGVSKIKNLTKEIQKGISPDYTENKKTMIVNQATFSKGFFDIDNIRYANNPYKLSKG